MDEGAGDGLTAVIRQAIQHWSELPDSEALSVECLRTVGLSGEVRGLDAIIPFVSLPLDPVAHLPWHEKAKAEMGGELDARRGSHQRVRRAAFMALQGIVEAVEGLDWLVFDEMARRNGYATYGARQAWHNIEPDVLDGLPEDDGLRNAWLTLLCCHPNGYVREGALLHLAGASMTLAYPIALVRANDWVSAIRVIAMEAVRQVGEYGAHHLVVTHLPLLLRLEHCAREAHGPLIHDVLQSVYRDDGAALVQGMKSADTSIRRGIVKVASGAGRAARLGVVRRAVHDPDVLVRLWAVSALDELAAEGADESEALRDGLLTDPAGAIRRRVIEGLVERGVEAAVPTLRQALLDKNGAVRHLARFYLAKAGALSDFAPTYRTALADRSGHPAAALAGLGETGGREDCERVAAYLQHGSPRVVCAAIRALERLDPEGSRGLRREAILHDAPRVVREALGSLGAPLRGTDQRWLLARATAPLDERRAARLLDAANHLRAWPRLELLLRLVAAADEDGLTLSSSALAAWSPVDDERYAPGPPPVDAAPALRRAFADAKSRLTLPVRVRLERITAGLLDLG